ncbi:MAG: CPBP family intramembrane glutamic endopeptidase [Chitinophagaceae bacterium]
MKKILHHLKDYFTAVDKWILVLSAVFTSAAIFINYNYGINEIINRFSSEQQYLCWYFIFLIAFLFPYLLAAVSGNVNLFNNWRFVALLIIAPAIFAWKMSFNINFHFSPNEIKNAYWNQVFYWPFKLLAITAVLFLLWKIFDKDEAFYGLTTKNLQIRPYILMLLIMIPLVAAASVQSDFLEMYPKFQKDTFLTNQDNGLYKLLYELSYGSDFFSIELFFRGFLVLAFAKWAGKDAILPMAVFYCTIHFGKPLGECISSFFGGIILGVIVYQTRTIWGGLLVHLGIAWMMEWAGYLASTASP